MDDRTLEVIIKAQNETKAAFAEIQGQLAALQGQTVAANAGFLAMAATAMPGGQALGYLILAAAGLAAILAPLSFAVLAVAANIVAWTVISTVAIGAIGGLAAAVFLLGAANAGGLSPATEMVKTHQAVATAIKNHAKALDELAQAKAGVDVYELGKGHRAQNIAFAQSFVTATGQNLADAQHDMAEPVSGMGGPIAKLGAGIDDLQHHFEEVSRPFAEHIAMWATQFLPVVEKAGDAIAKWFGDRMPGIFRILNILMADFSGFWKDIFTTIGRVVDYFIANSGQFDGFLRGFLGVFAGIFRVTMEIMMNVATWFQQNWPGIAKTAGDAAKAIGEGFSLWAPALSVLIPQLGNDLKEVATHVRSLTPLWQAMGFVVGGVVTAIVAGLDGLLGVIQAIEWALQRVMDLYSTLSSNDHTNNLGPSSAHIGGRGTYGRLPAYVPSGGLGSPNVSGRIGI